MLKSPAPFASFCATSFNEDSTEIDQDLWEDASPSTIEVGSPKPKTNGATRAWLSVELKRDLVNSLTYMVHARLPREEWDEINGEVGLCIAQWCVKGSFDKVLADTEGKGPNWKTMAEFVFRSMSTRMLHRGKDLQLRDRTGARTQTEVRAGKANPAATKLAPDTWSACRVKENDGDGSFSDKVGQSFDIVDQHFNPEQSAASKSHVTDCLDTAKEILKVKRPRGADRRVKVLEAVLRGAAKGVIEDELGVSDLRAAFLRQEVRDDLRDGLEMIARAKKILEFVLDEPGSTKEEICQDLNFTPEQVSGATRILMTKRLLTMSPLGCLNPTRAAHNEDF